MSNTLKRIIFVFLILCMLVSSVLFFVWITDSNGGNDTSADVSAEESLTSPAEDSSVAEISQSENPSAAGESSAEVSEESTLSEEPSNEPSEESSEEPSEEPSEEGWQAVKHETAADFPENYIKANVTAKYIAVYNLTDNKFVYGKGENEKCYPASLTKLVTSMMLLEYYEEDDIITVGEEIKLIASDSSRAEIRVGDRMKIEMLLDAMLLPSGNDAAYTAAVCVGRKIAGENSSVYEALDAYYKATNEFVTSIGCTATHINCPDGYQDPDHYTTAWDFVIITAEARKYPLICKVVLKKTAEDKTEDGRSYTFTTTNRLIKEGTAYVTGMKTGFHDDAGYCFAATTNADGKEMIIVTMFSSSVNTRYTDASKLISAAYGWF